MSQNLLSNIGVPSGLQASSCGYCSPSGERSTENSSHHTAGFDAMRLSCDMYQKMIDRGWRRSGTWCYKPHLRTSCCPQYTIKLDTLEFKASKSQRKLINRWNRYILHGTKNADEVKALKGKATTQKNQGSDLTLAETLHSIEKGFIRSGELPEHDFEVTLEPSSFTIEKFNLYCKYQGEIHSDHRNSQVGFKRFLVDSPLTPLLIPYDNPRPSHLPANYGSYHQLYRVDGKLIAMAVLDILPSCVSSVYFMYDKEWEKFSLGKTSALRECSLAKEIHDCGVEDLKYQYLGFYIYTCQKMRYKGEYSPSFLADPETYEWYPIEKCRLVLDNNRYACFSNPQHSIPASLKMSTEEFMAQDPPEIEEDWLDEVRIMTEVREGTAIVVKITESEQWRIPELRAEMLWCTSGLGRELSKDILFIL